MHTKNFLLDGAGGIMILIGIIFIARSIRAKKIVLGVVGVMMGLLGLAAIFFS